MVRTPKARASLGTRPRPLIAGLLSSLALSSGSQAATLCVRVAPGPGQCTSTIGAALETAAAGDTIRVAGGTYVENVLVTRTVVLEGGWNDAFTARDPATFITTIRPAAPSRSVVSIQGAGTPSAVAPTLDGFVITGGRASEGFNLGGGLQVVDSDALVRNNAITGNVGFFMGGGVWVQRGAPRFEGNRIDNNRSEGGCAGCAANGGGISLEDTRATLVANVVTGNIVGGEPGGGAGYGGGIDVNGGGPVRLQNNTIRDNGASKSSSVAFGGGVAVRGAVVVLEDNLVQGNRAQPGERGLGGGLYVADATDLTLSGNIFADNGAGGDVPTAGPPLGGGAYLVRSGGTLRDNTFTGNVGGNVVPGHGGGLAVSESTLAIRGGEIGKNVSDVACTGQGGGLDATSSHLAIDAVQVLDNCAGVGGGITLTGTVFVVDNSIVAGNHAASTGGIVADAASAGVLFNDTVAANGIGIRTAGPLSIINSIVTGHTTGVVRTGTPPLRVQFNDFWLNGTDVIGLVLDTTNLRVDPRLDDAYRLTAISPLLDAGTRRATVIDEVDPGKTREIDASDHDIDGERRPAAGPSGLYRVDIGADEGPGDSAQHRVDLDRVAADLTVVGPGNPLENPASGGLSDHIGDAVLGADVDGDGAADLVVGAKDWADAVGTLDGTGRLFGLFNFGSRLTGTVDLLDTAPDMTVVSRYARQHVGTQLASGDLDGDGVADLVLGSSETDNPPAHPTVFILHGGSSLTGVRTLSEQAPADFRLRAPGPDFLAFAARNALTTGDLDGNGVADLIVADGLADDGAAGDAGAVFVVFGRRGLAGVRDLAATPADWTLYGPAAGSRLGAVAAGRVNDDAQLDLVARSDTTAWVLLGPRAAGAVHLSRTAADVVITGLQAGGVLVSDVTGDGEDDLSLGSGTDLYVIPGPLRAGETFTAASRAAIVLTGASAGSLAAADVVGDRTPDLIVGAPSLGRVFVVAGGRDFTGRVPLVDAASMIVESAAVSSLGIDVAAGDLDRDGRADLIVGSRGVEVDGHPANFRDAGAVFVVYGDPSACVLDVDGSGTASAGTDVIYIARHLLGIAPVPPAFRRANPAIAANAVIAARVAAAGLALDVDGDGRVQFATDVVYIARAMLGLTPVPASYRAAQPGIPPDPAIASKVSGLCP